MTKTLTKNNLFILIMLAILSVLVFLCVFPKTNVVLAWTPDSLTALSIDGQVVNVSGDEASLVGDETTPRWVLDGGVLTLDNYIGGAILASGDLRIVLKPETTNVITATNGSGLAISESVIGEGLLSISGNATLKIVSTGTNISVSAISARGGISIVDATIIASATSSGETITNGMARAIYSERGKVEITNSTLTLFANGAKGYAVNTGAAAISGAITFTNSNVSATSRGTLDDTAIRADALGDAEDCGDIKFVSGVFKLDSKALCVYGADVVIQSESFEAVASSGGVDARNSLTFASGDNKITAIIDDSTSAFGAKAQNGNITISGEQTKIFVETSFSGLLGSDDFVMSAGKLQVVTHGTGSYAGYFYGGVNVSGGVVMFSGKATGFIAIGEVFSHGVSVGGVVLNQPTVYFAGDGEVYGGERQLITIENVLYCQFEQADNTLSRGWKLEYDNSNTRFVLTLDGYNGGAISAEKSFAIVVKSGSRNILTTQNDKAISTKGTLVIGGSGYLEVNGGGGSFDSALFAVAGILINYTNIVASAGGYGLQCTDGSVEISDARVSASGSQYTIFSSEDMKIGEKVYLEEDFSSSGIYFNGGRTLIKNDTVSNETIVSLKIDGVSINVNANENGDGWSWSSDLVYLMLNGYDAGYIYCDGNLDIELGAGSINKVTNLAALTEKVENLTTYCGIVATKNLQIFGEAVLDIKVNGTTIYDVAYGIYSYGNMIIQESTLFVNTSYVGIVSKSGTISFFELELKVETLGNSIWSHGDMKLDDCSIDVLSYKVGMYSTTARIVFSGGNASVYGENRSAVANLDMLVGDVVFVTGAMIDASASALYSAFIIEDGVLVETYEKAIFKINGEYHDFTGEAIDRLDTEGWMFDFDTTNSKYVLQLKGYNGGTIIFSLNLEVVLLDDSINTVSYADNTTLGGMYSCFDIGGSLTIIGSGKLVFVGLAELGGIGIYTDGNCTINGEELEIDASGVARGMSISNALTIRSCEYIGNYITADKIYVNDGKITINSTNGTNCFLVGTLFQMTSGEVVLSTTASEIELSCIKSFGAVSVLGGILNANAIGKYGSAINAVGQISLFSERIECGGEGYAIKSQDDKIVFGESVLVFAGENFQNAVKTRLLKDTDKYVKTQLFIFALADAIFDNHDELLVREDMSIDLGVNFEYFEGLRWNGKNLVEGVDYLVENTFVILKNSFLISLPNGVQRIEMHFGGGFYKTLSLLVENSNVSTQATGERNYVGVIVVDSIALLLIAGFVWSVIHAEKKKSKKE